MENLRSVKISGTVLEITKTFPVQEVTWKVDRATVEQALKDIEIERDRVNAYLDEREKQTREILDEMDAQGIVTAKIEPVLAKEEEISF
jgi:hypothetical protein